MRTTFGIAALAAVAAARGRVGQDALSAQLRADPKFTSFLGRNNKSCKDVAEFNLRSGIYHHTDDIIAANNREAAHSSDKDHVVMGHNFMSDLTTEEMEQYFGLKMPSGYHLTTMASGTSSHHGGKKSKNRGRGLAGTTRAENVDHANDGYMYAVKDQGNCGSCWAFTALSTLEGSIAKEFGTDPVRLSEQQTVDCTLQGGNSIFDEDYNMGGCQGGWMDGCWKMGKDHGIMTNDDYPYTAKHERCKHDYNKVWGFVTGYKQIHEGTNISEIKAVLKKTPLSIAVQANMPAFRFYKSGVVKSTDGCGTSLNHGIVVVGYTDSGDQMDDDSEPEDDDNDNDDDDNDFDDDDAECKVEKWWYSCGSQRRMLRKSLGAGDDDGHDKYFKCQNSWGESFGDKGFIRLEIVDGGKGVCGMYQGMYHVYGKKD